MIEVIPARESRETLPNGDYYKLDDSTIFSLEPENFC